MGIVTELDRPLSTQGGARPRKGARPDALRILMCLLIVMTVSRIHQHFPIVAAARPAVLLVGLALVLALVKPKVLGDFKVWSTMWPARVVAALGVAACFSTVFGISLGASARFFLEEYSKTLLMAFLLMSTIRNARDLKLYAWAFVIGCGVLAWLSLFVFGMVKANAAGIYRLAALYTYDGNDICVVMLAGLGLCMLTYRTSGRLGKVASALVMLGIGVTIARSGSRGGFLGLSVFTAAFLAMPSSTPVRRRLVSVAVLAVALVLGSPSGYWRQMRTILAPEKDYNWTDPTGRRMAWERGLVYMSEYPLFGVGLNNFPRAEGTISERAKEWRPGMQGIWWMVPHNTYVQVGAEMGVPALILWCSLLIGGVVSSVRLRRRMPARGTTLSDEQRVLYRFSESLPLSFVGFAVSSTFVSFAYMDPLYILAACLVGMHVALLDRQKRGNRIARPPGSQHAAVATAATRRFPGRR